MTKETPREKDDPLQQLQDLVERAKRGEVTALQVLYRTADGKERTVSAGKKKPGTKPG